jgi:presenilin-like A22 family membrane protease
MLHDGLAVAHPINMISAVFAVAVAVAVAVVKPSQYISHTCTHDSQTVTSYYYYMYVGSFCDKHQFIATTAVASIEILKQCTCTSLYKLSVPHLFNSTSSRSR